MLTAATMPFAAAADSARAVATVYTVSLLALVPMLMAAVVAIQLRHASAQGRVLVWRCALSALLVVFVGRMLPLHWIAWVVPSSLATPLVALGRVQVAASALRVTHSARTEASAMTFVSALLALYGVGVFCVLFPTIVASVRARHGARQGPPLNAGWRDALAGAAAKLGMTRHVEIIGSESVAVPMTWGMLRPVIVIPAIALDWPAEQREMVLLHELAHVRAADWPFKVLARLVCALYWFHPGVWWLAGALDADCEIACDDRVIAAGARRSDYAELLAMAADRLLPSRAALALANHRGLRARLCSVLDARQDVRPLARRWTVLGAACTVLVAGPVSAVQLAPTREVLTSLVRDARWETRAYAVIGLASRADSLAVAQRVAERDPSPSVRAWARYALDQHGGAESARLPLHP
jgi:beta-lactamase regulating signal transducer with metallopeptidase domain